MTKKEKLVDHLVEEYFTYDHKTGIIYNIKSRGPARRGSKSGTTCVNDYVQIKFYGKYLKAHRLAWRLHFGYWPTRLIDHINGIKTDNRICNLRESTKRENGQNRKEHRNGFLLGASYHKRDKSFRTQITIHKKSYHLGYFKTELEAHEQYLRAVKAIETRDFKSAKELRDYLKKV